MKLFKSFKYLDVRNIYKDTVGENTPGQIMNKIKPLVRKKAEGFITELKSAREKLKDIPGTNYKLGIHHLQKGNIDEAIFRFKIVTSYLDQNRADAYYNLGRCLLIRGDLALAEENLQKALALKADFPEVTYILDKIKSPESIDSIPENIIAQHIEWHEEDTDISIEIRQQQDKFLVSSTLANILDKNPNLEVLDLGCAFGGRGSLLRNKEVTRKIIGVDIYTKATEKAAKQLFQGEPVYNSISNNEISKYLSQNQEKFDVILAGNVFSYKGNLQGIFSDIARALKTAGMFVAIIENNNIDEHYKLDIAKDIFTHSDEYITKTLKTCGLSIEDKKGKDIEDRKFSIIIAKNQGN